MILYQELVLKKLLVFTSLILAFNSVTAQIPVTNIPSNGIITTIHNWLVAKPLPSTFSLDGIKNQEVLDGFSTDFLTSIGGEKSPNIKANHLFKTPDGKNSSFSLHSWKPNYIDLTEIFGRPSDVFTYLFAELESKINQEVYLHIGTNDAGKVWINGKLVIQYLDGRSAEPSQNVSKISLKKGRNTILLKIDQLGGGWGAYAQVYSLEEQHIFDKKRAKLLSNSSKIATIIKTKVICKQSDRYIGWPTITKTNSGELLAVFSGNRDGHVCPFGITQMIRSNDNGKTWSEPETINNTPLDDRDPGILETKSGTWIISWFTSLAFDTKRNYAENPAWKRHGEKLSKETKTKWLGNWIRRSTDKGKTWEKPIKQSVTAPHGPIELKDGRLLYVGTANIKGEKKLAVEISNNDGVNWNIIATISIPKDESIAPYSEPHVVELPNGKLLAMFRYNSNDRSNSYLRQSESYDDGKTWTVTHKTNIWGYPPHLLLLNNGWLLVTYGLRKIPYSERACISKDEGKTWDIDNEIILHLSDSGDLGYPASVQLDDSSIITIYYQIDKEGEKTSLMQTHWKLKNNDIIMPVKGICAHRGANETHPENTNAAFKEAIQLGAQMIEFDVRMTKDKKLIIMHDKTVDRTTNGKGLVSNLTLEEIKNLDAGSWKSKKYAGEKVPTFKETLEIMPKNIWLNIHLKGGEELGKATAKILLSEGRIHQGVIACGFDAAAGVKKVNSNIMICNMERQENRAEYIEETIKGKYAFIQLLKKRNDSSLENDIKKLKKNNIKINYYFGDSKEEVKELFELEVDFVLTNQLSEMMQIMEQ